MEKYMEKITTEIDVSFATTNSKHGTHNIDRVLLFFFKTIRFFQDDINIAIS
jgi:hypothetical protein